MKNKFSLISAIFGLVSAYITYALYNAVNYAVSRAGYSGLTNIVLGFTPILSLVVAILLAGWLSNGKDANKKKDIYVLVAVFAIAYTIMQVAQLKL